MDAAIQPSGYVSVSQYISCLNSSSIECSDSLILSSSDNPAAEVPVLSETERHIRPHALCRHGSHVIGLFKAPRQVVDIGISLI